MVVAQVLGHTARNALFRAMLSCRCNSYSLSCESFTDISTSPERRYGRSENEQFTRPNSAAHVGTIPACISTTFNLFRPLPFPSLTCMSATFSPAGSALCSGIFERSCQKGSATSDTWRWMEITGKLPGAFTWESVHACPCYAQTSS